MKFLGWIFFIFLLSVSACKPAKAKKTVTEYTFTVMVREKYCRSERLAQTLVKETEKEKPYASQQLYLIKKGTTDTLNFPTTLNGEFTRKLEDGAYQIYFPEKFANGGMSHTKKCKDWRLIPDTTVIVNPSQPNIRLNLYRPCSPCNPIRD